MGRFERIRYPDGQISAKFIPPLYLMKIKERINSYEDLMFVRSIAEIIQSHPDLPGTEKFTLNIPCLFGQRSDRRFSEDNSFDLKLIAEIINDCKFKRVEIFDPHSDVALAMINNSVRVSSFGYVQKAASDLVERKLLEDGHYGKGDLVLVSPDAGAYKKVFDYGTQLGLPVMAAVKHRDLEGNVELKFIGDVSGKDCLIVDDLCDGGYTFIVLADALRKQGARRVYLYISHGLFSKGFAPLFDKIDHIYCTNSVKDVDMESTFEFTFQDGASAVFPVKDYVTQYNII